MAGELIQTTKILDQDEGNAMKKNVFISYRSSNGGSELAKLLKEKLEKDYYVTAFMDVDNLQAGKFGEQLLEEIKNCDSVVLVLAPGALNQCSEKGDWVRIEIECALEHHKNIVPVFAEGFESPDEGAVPDSIYEAIQYQGVPFSKQYADDTIRKLAGYIRATPRCRLRSKVMLVVALFMVAALSIFLTMQQDKKADHHLPDFDETFNDHLVIEWKNASHQYKEGLNSWKRLDYDRAESDILAALEEMSRQAAQSEVEVAAVNNSLGCLYLDMGKYEQAYDYLNSAYVTFEEAYGAESIEARAAQFSIAQHDYFTGDTATALKMCEAILDTTDADQDRIVVTAVKHFKARILDERGQWEEALAVYEEVLGLYVDEDGELMKTLTDFVYNPELAKNESDYSTNAARWAAITYNAMGGVYIHMQNYNDARRALDRGMNICSSNSYIGEKDMITADIYRNLAVVYGHRGEDRRGMDCIDRAKRIVWNIFGYEENHPSLIEIYEAYGDQYRFVDDEVQARDYYDKALDLAADAYGENHPQTARACNVLGLYYYSIADHGHAISFFQRAIEIRKNILGVDYVDTVEYYVNLAKAQVEQKDWEGAGESLLCADEICSRLGIESTLANEIRQLSEEVSDYE